MLYVLSSVNFMPFVSDKTLLVEVETFISALLLCSYIYIYCLLKCRAISRQVRTYAFILYGGTTRSYSAIVPTPLLFLVHGMSYHMIYARSNHRIILV